MQETLYAVDNNKPGPNVASPHKERRELSGKFQWAVQNFEAGEYEQAISEFKSIEKQGTKSAEYEWVPFYLGMSYFRNGDNTEALPYLESFLKKENPNLRQQEARIALLLAYERLKQWDKVTALAGESDKLNLFQQNKVLLKLIWAQALTAKKEVLGARTMLKEADALIQNMPQPHETASVYQDPERDVLGRFHFVSLTLRLRECAEMSPRTVGEGKKTAKLYANWLEAETDCYRFVVRAAASDLYPTESNWTLDFHNQLTTALTQYADKVRASLKGERENLAMRENLLKWSRQNFYRLQSSLDDEIKNFKNRSLNHTLLEQLRKQIDHLIVSFSSP